MLLRLLLRLCNSLEADLHFVSDIVATKNCHRISTLFAGLGVPQKDRELFYSHMGHSEDINRNVCQALLAIQELTIVGMQLMQIDQGKLHRIDARIRYCTKVTTFRAFKIARLCCACNMLTRRPKKMEHAGLLL